MSRSLGKFGLPASVVALFACTPAFGNLLIVPTYDPSTFATLSSANQTTVQNTINSVINTYEAEILNPITVNITFEIDQSVLGETTFSVYSVPYSGFVTALSAHAVSSDDFVALGNLTSNPTLDPVIGHNSIDVKAPLVRALGINNLAANQTTLDGTIGLGTNQMNLSRTGPQDPNKYDLQGVVSHEINEVLGLGSSLGLGLSLISPEDLFRYTGTSASCAATNGRSYTASSSAISCFSIDGTTGLAAFNQGGFSLGDYGDWASSSTVRVQDAFAMPGTQPNQGLEWRALDVIGYTVAPATAPEPGTGAVLGMALGALGLLRAAVRRVGLS